MKKTIFLILTFIISIIVFELFLRFSPFSYGITPVQYDKEVGMWHKKNFSNYIIRSCYKKKYSFDEEGRVKNNYKYDKNKKDIVLLGDSQIEALMVNNEQIIHNNIYKNINGKFNVLNYGLSGNGPSQQYHILMSRVNKENISTLVHFIFLENDLNDGDPDNFNGTARPKVYMKFKGLDNFETIKPTIFNFKEMVRDFLGNFEIYVYLKKTFYFYSKKVNNFSKKPIKLDKEVQINKHFIANENYKWQQLNGSIYQINKISKINNFKYKVVFYSAFEHEGDINYSNKFANFLKAQKIDFLNITTFIKNLEKKQKIDFECDGHWNENTHKQLAKYLTKKIKL